MPTSTSPLLLRACAGGVLTLTLNRPEVLNGLNDDLLDAITAGCVEAATDDAVRVVVVTGAGRAFCSGQDLKAGGGGGDAGVRNHLSGHYVPAIKAIRELEKPVVAAVNGVAAGAGLSLALACDFRIAAESATFVQAFVRIGLVPDAGGSYFLPRLVGIAKALEMSMIGDSVDAAQAVHLGLATRVVADEQLAAATAEFAARLARGPRSVGMIKALLSTSLDNDLDAQLAREADFQEAAAATDDFREGVTAFVEKRRPSFTGR
jgi:2-(1,2-epoxy-1,2-dihydrophenyl)acetyl-CoA isomerase